MQADAELDGLLMALGMEVRRRELAKSEEAARWPELEGKKWPVVANATVLWQGWEMDGTAWVVDKDGALVAVVSNHGELQEEGAEDLLRSKLEELYSSVNHGAHKYVIGSLTAHLAGSPQLSYPWLALPATVASRLELLQARPGK
jgi:hypothetical protein